MLGTWVLPILFVFPFLPRGYASKNFIHRVKTDIFALDLRDTDLIVIVTIFAVTGILSVNIFTVTIFALAIFAVSIFAVSIFAVIAFTVSLLAISILAVKIPSLIIVVYKGIQ